MTLAEWVGRLYEGHSARREYDALAAEVRRLRQQHAEAVKQLAQLREWKDAACKTMQDYVRSGERHAAAVEMAFREGFRDGVDEECNYRATGSLGDIDAAWRASLAKVRLT